jgi:hypothetical protein
MHILPFLYKSRIALALRLPINLCSFPDYTNVIVSK